MTDFAFRSHLGYCIRVMGREVA